MFSQNIREIIKKFNNIIEYMELYYKIMHKILNDYIFYKNRNFNVLLNLNKVNDSITEEINNIKFNYNYGYNLNIYIVIW